MESPTPKPTPGLQDWKDHGANTPRSEESWIAILGPDTPALGERTRCTPLKADQIAATIAAFLGEDYRSAFPVAGQPVADVFTPGKAGAE